MSVRVKENRIPELEKRLKLWKGFVNLAGKKYPHYDLTSESNWIKVIEKVKNIVEKLETGEEDKRELLKKLFIYQDEDIRWTLIFAGRFIGVFRGFINNAPEEKLKEFVNIVIDVKNSNQFKDEWINKTYELIKSEYPQAENLPLRGHLSNIFGELYGKLHIEENEPIMNGCSQNFLNQFYEFEGHNYNEFKETFEMLKQKYLEIVGKLSEFPDEFINLEIDLMFNFFNSVRLYEIYNEESLESLRSDLKPGDIVIIRRDSKVVEILSLDNDDGNWACIWQGNIDTPINIPLKLEKTIDKILEQKGQVILYGVPGTGKTWLANEYIKKKIKENSDGVDVEDIRLRNNEDWNSFAEMFRKILENKNISHKNKYGFTTFHQSYAYEEFIEGFRPKTKDNGNENIMYEVEDGIFKKMCILAIYEALKVNSLNNIEFNIDFNDIEDVDEKIYKKIKEIVIEKLKEHKKSKNVFKSEDFKNAPKYYLIIDEINRGNISNILGELITLLEMDKRLTGKNEIIVTLPYSRDPFAVPPNLYIIGTMNTADRSIALLDIALRRRFGFIEIEPEEELLRKDKLLENWRKICKDNDNEYQKVENELNELFNKLGSDEFLKNLLKSLNKRIVKLKDKDHRIGHSYFLKVKDIEDLKFVWFYEIIPLLEEYFYDDWDNLKEILGEYKENNRNIEYGFVEEEKVDNKPIYRIKRYEEFDEGNFIRSLKSIISKNNNNQSSNNQNGEENG